MENKTDMFALPSAARKQKKKGPLDLDDFDPTLGMRQLGNKSKLQQMVNQGQQIQDRADMKVKSADHNVDFKPKAQKEMVGGVDADEILDERNRLKEEKEIAGNKSKEVASLNKMLKDKSLPEMLRTALVRKKEKLTTAIKAEKDAAVSDTKTRSVLAKTKKPTSELAQIELEQDGESKRKATKQILKNRGLIRVRPKKDRNSRVKHRIKYEKALKKRKSTNQEVRQAEDSYQGELTGIRTNLVKSHKIRA